MKRTQGLLGHSARPLGGSRDDALAPEPMRSQQIRQLRVSGTVPFIRARPSRAMAPRPVALLDAAAAGWADAASALHGAVVYLDAGAAAAVAPLGLPLLLGLGALAACDLAQPRPSVRAAAHAQREALSQAHLATQDGALQGGSPTAVVVVLTRPPSEAHAAVVAALKARPKSAVTPQRRLRGREGCPLCG
jgi:hypothetical protein